MQKDRGIILTIQGKAKQKTVKQLIRDSALNENQGWYFIDYASEEVPLHAKFDVLLEGKSKKTHFRAWTILAKIINLPGSIRKQTFHRSRGI